MLAIIKTKTTEYRLKSINMKMSIKERNDQ